MSITKEITISIWCDKCGVWVTRSQTKTDIVRAAAKKNGWTRDDEEKKDYCPACSAKRKEK